mmetsp:Transcript_110298/g.311865  ORF Transcript_110298/g.311865 Transcript_110298/m.311865 type:complete len:478 (+) Transcript_110298:293-1726(+)
MPQLCFSLCLGPRIRSLMPKSVRRSKFPSLETIKLAGLRSRWQTMQWCRCATAATSCRRKESMSCIGNVAWPLSPVRLARNMYRFLSPAKSVMMIRSCAVCRAPRECKMLGCLGRWRLVQISLFKAIRSLTDLMFALGSTFTATVPNSGHCALKTAAASCMWSRLVNRIGPTPTSPCSRTSSLLSCGGMLSRVVAARFHRNPRSTRRSDCLACLFATSTWGFTIDEIRVAVISARWMYSNTRCLARGRGPETGRMASAPSSSSLSHAACVLRSATRSSGSSSSEGVTTSNGGEVGTKLITSQSCAMASMSTTAETASIPFSSGKQTSASKAAAASALLLPSCWQALTVASRDSASMHCAKPHAFSSWVMSPSWPTTSISSCLSSPNAERQCKRCCLCCTSLASAFAAWHAAVPFFPSPPCTTRRGKRLYMAGLGGSAGLCGMRGSVGNPLDWSWSFAGLPMASVRCCVLLQIPANCK